MGKRKGAVGGLVTGLGMAKQGEGIRSVSEIVTSASYPTNCLCMWSAVSAWPTGRGWAGWRLKFRHAGCPAKLHGEHG